MNQSCAIVSGGYRTGSTFIYISAIEIFIHNFPQFNQGIKLNSELQNYDFNLPGIFKSHDFFPDGESFKIIHTIRNPFDILSSLKKCRVNLPDYMEEVKQIILRDQGFKLGENTLILKYEHFFGQEIKAIDAIIKFLNLDYPYRLELAERENYQNVKKYTDKLKPGNPTPYTANHISNNPEPGNYRKYLNKDEILKLREFLQEQNIDKY